MNSPPRRQIRVAINGRFINQPVTGVQRYSRAVVEELDRAADEWGEIDFTLLTPKLTGPPPALRTIKIRECGRLTGQLWEQFELPMQADFDVLLCLGNTAPAAALLSGRKVITVVHDLSPQLFPGGYNISFRAAYRALVPLIMRRADAVITVSQSARDTMIEHYPMVEGRLHVVLNGGAPTRELANSYSPVDGPYVLYVGSLSKLKNIHSVLEVARRMLNDYPNYKFVLVGKRNAIFQDADQPDGGTPGGLVFAGQLNDFSELAAYYRHATALVFPSHSESSGLPPVEAMAFGCPVVVSRIPGLMERCGDAALYCDPDRPDDIYAKLRDVLDNSELRKTLAAAGKFRAQRFSWRNCAKSILEIVQDVSGSTPARAASAAPRPM